jgi:hypothetical protein
MGERQRDRETERHREREIERERERERERRCASVRRRECVKRRAGGHGTLHTHANKSREKHKLTSTK